MGGAIRLGISGGFFQGGWDRKAGGGFECRVEQLRVLLGLGSGLVFRSCLHLL